MRAELNGIQIWAVPVIAPDRKLSAARIVLRSADPDATDIVTFDGISITGDLHQIAIPAFFGPSTTPTIDEIKNVPEWEAFDSHFLISAEDMRRGAGAEFSGPTESNDQSNPLGINETAPLFQETLSPITGYGTLQIDDPFFLDTDQNRDEVAIAYLVVAHADTFEGDAEAADPVFNVDLTVLGDGFSPTRFDVGFAFVRYIPEPGTGTMTLMAAGVCLMRRRRK